MASTMQLGRRASIGESLLLSCHSLANFDLLQVYGCDDQQWPQACELCRILQVGIDHVLMLISKPLTFC